VKPEVHHIRALKGKRQLTELNVQSAEQAAAAQAAGIDIVVSGWRADFPARRAAARFPGQAETVTLTPDQAAAMAAFLADPRHLETP